MKDDLNVFNKFERMTNKKLTGVNSCGVAAGDDISVVNLMPDPRSKSHIFIGHNSSVLTQRMFSGFRSLCAIPFL